MAGNRTAVFVSYRRDDTRHVAGRLGDRLTQRFGHVFMDIDTIEPGVDFTAAIRRAVSECDVLLALIGENWVDAVDEHGARRLDNPEDWIVQEIKVALDRDIRVVPVLVDSAPMPTRGELPAALAPLVNRHAATLRYESFDSDAERLIGAIEKALAGPADAGAGVDRPGDDGSPPPAAGTPGEPDTDQDGPPPPEEAGEVDASQPPPATEPPEGAVADLPDGSQQDEADEVDRRTTKQREADDRRRRIRAAALAMLVIGAAVGAGALLRGGPEPPDGCAPGSPPGIPCAAPLPPGTIVVPREETDGYTEIFAVDSDGRTAPALIDTGGHDVAFPVLAPGRGSVVYQTPSQEGADEVKTLRVVAVDGTGDRELFDRPEDCQWMLRPSWNPVERDQIAVPCLDYKVDDQPLEFSLRIYRLDGQIVRTLASGPRWIDDVTFSRNGETVTFATGTPAEPVIHSIPAQGGTPVSLTAGRDPTWSPTSDRILFIHPAYPGDVEARTPATIRVMDPDGSNIEYLTSGAHADYNPGWSPDGEDVVFRSNYGSPDGPWRAWLVAADGRGEPRELAPDDEVVVDGPPAWASR